MDCIFCRIIKEEIPCARYYESDDFIAFLDKNPVVEGHTLFVTKRHARAIYDLNDEEIREFGRGIKDVCGKLKQKYGDSVCVVNTNGDWASQSIKHFHVHIIPRQEDDRLWDDDKSRIVLDRSSGFPRLSPEKEELFALASELEGN